MLKGAQALMICSTVRPYLTLNRRRILLQSTDPCFHRPSSHLNHSFRVIPIPYSRKLRHPKRIRHWRLTVPRINAEGLAILRQFEAIPSYAEQSIREIEQAVMRLVQVPLTSNQFSALVSLTYNLGEANLRRSQLLQQLNAGYYQAAADQFDCWVYVGDHRQPELVARRIAEKELFLRS